MRVHRLALLACGIVSPTSLRGQAPTGVYRMVRLGLDTNATQMALTGTTLPAQSPIGRVLDGRIVIHADGQVDIRVTLIRVGRSDTSHTFDVAQFLPGQIGNIYPLTGQATRYLHRVGSRWYFLPGQGVRIALQRESK